MKAPQSAASTRKIQQIMIVVKSVAIGVGVGIIGACLLAAGIFAMEIAYDLWGN